MAKAKKDGRKKNKGHIGKAGAKPKDESKKVRAVQFYVNSGHIDAIGGIEIAREIGKKAIEDTRRLLTIKRNNMAQNREPGYYWVKYNQTIAPGRQVEKWVIAEWVCISSTLSAYEWKVTDYNSIRCRKDSDFTEIGERVQRSGWIDVRDRLPESY